MIGKGPCEVAGKNSLPKGPGYSLCSVGKSSDNCLVSEMVCRTTLKGSVII